MNAIERITKAINFETPDRTPVIPQIFGHAAIISKVPLHEYLQDGELLARCQINAYQRYRYDAVFALMDVCVETEALGSVLEYKKNYYPLIKKYALSNTTDLELLSIPDPYQTK